MGLMSPRDEPLHGEADGALLSADTLDALDLHGQPFLHTVPEHGRFVDETTEAQLDDVRQALIAGDDLLLVLGPPGSGRSILLDVLNDQSGTRIQCFQVAGSERFDTDNLFAGMLEAFKQPAPEDLKQALDELIPCLQGMDERNTLCVVIVDDAEAVDDNELTRLLSSMLYLNSGDETLLRMVFAASEDFEDRIPDLLPEGADLPYSILGMEPLEDDRAASFLAFRLEQAGHADASPFDDADVAVLNDRASGRPGTLQSLAAEALNERFGSLPAGPTESGFAGNLPAMDDKRRKLIFGAVAAVLILAGLLLFLPSPDESGDPGQQVADNTSAETEVATGAGSEAETEAENAERLRLLRESANEERARELAAEEAAAARDEEAAIARAEALAAARLEADSDAQSETDDAEQADSRTVAADTGNSDAPDTSADEAPATNTDDDSAASADDGTASRATAETPDESADAPVGEPAAAIEAPVIVVPEPVAEPADDVEIEPPADGTLSAEELAAEDPNALSESDGIETAELPVGTLPSSAPAADEQGTAGEPVAADDNASQPATTAGTLESPNWILVQAPDQFTVQMIAAIDRQSVDTFLQRSNLPSPNSVFSFERGDVVWHAMVHGLYPTIEAAQAAIDNMPEEIRRNDPWIRAIGRLQETVREQNP